MLLTSVGFKMQSRQVLLLVFATFAVYKAKTKEVQECEKTSEYDYVCREIESFGQLERYIEDDWQSVKIVNEHTAVENDDKPHAKLSKLRRLDLSQSDGLILGSLGFKDLTALEELNITHCKLEDELHAEHFENKSALVNLDVSYNDLQIIHGALLKQLPNLVYGNFSENLIAYIEPDAFKDLKDLLFLDFTTNYMQNISIGSNANLRFLSISNNDMYDFKWCRLRGLPKLEELHLHSNWLENLDIGIFYALPQLRVLNVSNNNLYEISQGLFIGPTPNDLPLLELLDYSSNNVKVLEDYVFIRLQHMKTLNLWSNQINKISAKAFVGLSQLKSLQLQNNNLRDLPDELFGNLTALETLDLSKNKIRQMGANLFGNILLKDLKYLNLSNNYIEQLHPLAFSSLPFLQELRLRRNKLISLDIRMFAPLRRLQLLTLSENRLMDIDEHVLSSLDKLTELEINNNRLSFLPSLELHQLLPRLRHINIEGNPWQCQCLDEMTTWLHAHQVGYTRSNSAYFSGRKPLCVVSSVEECVRDLQEVHAQGIVENYEAI